MMKQLNVFYDSGKRYLVAGGIAAVISAIPLAGYGDNAQARLYSANGLQEIIQFYKPYQSDLYAVPSLEYTPAIVVAGSKPVKNVKRSKLEEQCRNKAKNEFSGRTNKQKRQQAFKECGKLYKSK